MSASRQPTLDQPVSTPDQTVSTPEHGTQPRHPDISGWNIEMSDGRPAPPPRAPQGANSRLDLDAVRRHLANILRQSPAELPERIELESERFRREDYFELIPEMERRFFEEAPFRTDLRQYPQMETWFQRHEIDHAERRSPLRLRLEQSAPYSPPPPPAPSSLRKYAAIVSFVELCQFARQYMINHASGNEKGAQSDLVYLMDSRNSQFRTGLIDAAGDWVEPGQSLSCGSSPVYDSTWGNWHGYHQRCPFDFKWQSCTGSVLTAIKMPDDPDHYRIECTPPAGRDSCGYIELFGCFEISFDPVIESVEEQPEQQPSVEQKDRDVEPDWPSNVYALSRAASGC